jgi:vacuole morphology and inheritance protein 14
VVLCSGGIWPLAKYCARRLERVVREACANKDHEKVRKIIDQLCHEYAYAVHQPHARNGGLIGLAAASIALGPVIEMMPSREVIANSPDRRLRAI